MQATAPCLSSLVLSVSLLEPCVLQPLPLLSCRDIHTSSICVVLGTAGEAGELGLGLLHSSIPPWGHCRAAFESSG